MKYYGDKVLLILLRALVYLKRCLFWLGRLFAGPVRAVVLAWDKTLGFYLYKLWFFIRKRIEKYKIPLDSRFVEVIGKRSTLQVVLFVVVLFVMYPQSRLYSQDIARIPGRDTLFYSLVGPGEQDYGEIEIIVEEANFDHPEGDSAVWKQGAASVESPSNVGRDTAALVQELSSVSAGGTAITKPTILPGSSIPSSEDPARGAGKRTATVEYQVQPGDVIGGIAQKFGISVDTILWANSLTERSTIRPGDTLKILPASGVTHKVVSGDTVIKIARKYDSEVGKVVDANRLQRDGSDIVVGEELFIPDGTIAQPIIPRSIVSGRPSGISSISAPPPSVSAPAGSGYLWPTSVRHITQYFGLRHTGVDIAGPIGTPLYASRTGTIIKSQCGWNGGYGCYIIIDHGGGIQTLYGHASELFVSVGQQVSQGQTIAAMGSTGRSTGPHVHFEVRSGGQRVNPLSYVR